MQVKRLKKQNKKKIKMKERNEKLKLADERKKFSVK